MDDSWIAERRPNRRRSYRGVTAAALLALLLAACSGGGRTAVVTERPNRTQDAVHGDGAEGTDQAARDARQMPAEGSAPDPYASVEVGRFDTGKMWTFDHPPIDYFEETYGFRPDSAWFARARLGALRLPNCSASFVSPAGLILTNHHCARESVSDVTREGETLLDDGFYAASLGEERQVEDLYVDQLIEIEDITEEVYDVAANVDDVVAARRQRSDQIERRMEREAKGRDSLLTVEVIELYHGGQYSAYTFRRYDDIRLVFAPELAAGAFGGDPDNFTYPRYSLDFSFFRAYGPTGEPLETQHYFTWDEDGARDGEAVFVIGNPGTTSRLATISQLEFERDFALPTAVDVLRTRMEILGDYIAAHPEEAREHDLRNTHHQISNQLKKNEGELAGLRDSMLIARRQKAENQLLQEIASVDTLLEAYGGVIEQIRRVQLSKEASADQSGAFAFFGSPAFDSHVLVRSVYGYIMNLMQQRGAPQSAMEELREDAVEIEDWPADLEKAMLAARLQELRDYLGENDPTVTRLLQGRSPESVAERMVSATALTDSTQFVALLDEGFLSSGDAAVDLAQAVTPLYFSIQQQVTGLESREQELNADLARARFALYGTEIPPDATFSLRIADGIVSGYPYNGTTAPPNTTFFGMYNHYYSYGGEDTDWDLPSRWLEYEGRIDLSTPVNLVTTNDITGGNSGSPLLDAELNLVGVAFDSNIDALQNTYIYLDERGRAISVDSRGMLEALDDMYDADRIALELTTGVLYETEADADAVE